MMIGRADPTARRHDDTISREGDLHRAHFPVVVIPAEAGTQTATCNEIVEVWLDPGLRRDDDCGVSFDWSACAPDFGQEPIAGDRWEAAKIYGI